MRVRRTGLSRGGGVRAVDRRDHRPSRGGGPGPIRRRTGTLVGRAVASVANLLDLQLAVVAGSVALGFGTTFFDAAQEEIELRARLDFSRSTRIVPAGLGADGPLVGAAAVGRRRPGRAGRRTGRRPVTPEASGWSPSPEGRLAIRLEPVLRRPDLWWTALGALRRLAPPGWWRPPPHLPLPDRRLWEFRMVTAYGSPDAAPEPADVISYLEWCRSTAAADGQAPCGGRPVRRLVA